jgi:hypothetical protein
MRFAHGPQQTWPAPQLGMHTPPPCPPPPANPPEPPAVPPTPPKPPAPPPTPPKPPTPTPPPVAADPAAPLRPPQPAWPPCPPLPAPLPVVAAPDSPPTLVVPDIVSVPAIPLASAIDASGGPWSGGAFSRPPQAPPQMANASEIRAKRRTSVVYPHASGVAIGYARRSFCRPTGARGA